MYAADEVFALDELEPDDEIRPFVERCTAIDDGEPDSTGRMHYTGCDKPAVNSDDDSEPRCAEHLA
jgi:hypothetical protein